MSGSSGDPDSEITVMTQNLYFGAELAPIFQARSPSAMLRAVAEAWAQVEASMIEERAERIAKVIAEFTPDLVALQEAAQWFNGSGPSLTIKYDFLALILRALTEHGVFYIPIAIGRNFDSTAPTGTGDESVRIVDRDAILLRISGTEGQVKPWNIEQGRFAMLMEVVSPVIGKLEIQRGWLAVDVSAGRRNFRFINTHLESYSAKVQMAQTAELIGGPANTGFPVILAGDFNSDANLAAGDSSAAQTARAYADLIAAGMKDSWTAANPDDAGNTCCQDAKLRNAQAEFSSRIDLILTRGGITTVAARLVAEGAESLTPSGLWPSDHAGVIATLRIT
jgi:endonuclease/exonuclease/phosphatase family metal-dependent hydrolase